MEEEYVFDCEVQGKIASLQDIHTPSLRVIQFHVIIDVFSSGSKSIPIRQREYVLVLDRERKCDDLYSLTLKNGERVKISGDLHDLTYMNYDGVLDSSIYLQPYHMELLDDA